MHIPFRPKINFIFCYNIIMSKTKFFLLLPIIFAFLLMAGAIKAFEDTIIAIKDLFGEINEI